MIIINYNIIQHCIIPNISQIVGEHPVSVIVNKIDLLPVFIILYRKKLVILDQKDGLEVY